MTHHADPEAHGLMGRADPLELVQALAEGLAATEHVGEVGASVVEWLHDLLGASAVMVGLHDEERGHLLPLASRGMSARTEELLDEPIAIVPGEPSHAVLYSGEPTYWSTVDERNAQFPRYSSFPTSHESWSVLPLVTRERGIGILAIGWRESRAFTRDDKALLRAVAHQCATALDRAALLEAEREERLHSNLLAEGTRIMASALDPDQILRGLVRLAVPSLAPFCAVYVAEGDVLRRVALEVEDTSELSERLRAFDQVPITAPTPLAEAYRSRSPQVVPEVSYELVARVYPKELADQLVGSAGAGRTFAALAVPVISGGRSIGVISIVSDRWGGQPSEGVVRVAEGLAGRAGVALNVAARYQREHETALVLTEALLPSTHRVPGRLDVASRYLPVGGSVAGDWFDVARAGPDRYVFGVGDAAGHGIRAAALMSELRSAARGLAAAGESPAGLLRGLGWLLAETADGEFATALYALTDATGRWVTWAAAGHPPPVHLGRGDVRFLETNGATPLGCPFGTEPADQTLELGVGEGLVLYSDGLLERRSGRYEERSDSLLEVLSGCATERAEVIAQALVESHCQGRQDDCCILVLRRTS